MMVLSTHSYYDYIVVGSKLYVCIFTSDKNRGPVKAWGHSVGIGSDTDSASGSSSNKSHDSSPSNSPHANMRRQLVASQSLDELAEEEPEKYANGL